MTGKNQIFAAEQKIFPRKRIVSRKKHQNIETPKTFLKTKNQSCIRVFSRKIWNNEKIAGIK